MSDIEYPTTCGIKSSNFACCFSINELLLLLSPEAESVEIHSFSAWIVDEQLIVQIGDRFVADAELSE